MLANTRRSRRSDYDGHTYRLINFRSVQIHLRSTLVYLSCLIAQHMPRFRVGGMTNWIRPTVRRQPTQSVVTESVGQRTPSLSIHFVPESKQFSTTIHSSK